MNTKSILAATLLALAATPGAYAQSAKAKAAQPAAAPALTATSASAAAPDSKLMNLRLEPHWLVFTELATDAQFRLSEHFSVGPTLAYMADGNGVYYGTKVASSLLSDLRTERVSAGVRGAWYLSGVSRHSFYTAAFARYSSSKVTHKGGSSFFSPSNDQTATFSETTVGLTLGYHWVVGKVLTFNAGAGPALYSHPQKIVMRGNGGGSTTLDMRKGSEIGYVLDAGMGFRF